MAAPMLAVVEPFVTSAPSVTSAMNEGTMTAKVWAVQFGGWPEFVYKDRVAEDWYRNRWIDANLDGDARDFPSDRRDPICYTVDALIAIQGVGIAVTPENAFDPADARIVGRVQGQDRFTVNTVQASSIPGVGWVVSGSPVIGTIAPPPTIALWENWTIDWRVDVFDEAAGDWVSYPAGSTNHDLHFILRPPTPSFRLHHSLIAIGCKRAHGLGFGDEVEIASRIFEEFEDQVVFRAQDVLEDVPNHQPLKYYDNWATPVTVVSGLLHTGDGQCAAWAQFYLHCVWATGADPGAEGVEFEYNTPPHIGGGQAWMFVSRWVVGASTNPDPITSSEYPSINITLLKYDWLDFIDSDYYHFIYMDVADMTGLSGQSTSDPASLFVNHKIIKIGTTLYDPSYGERYDTGGATGNAMLASIDSAIDCFALAWLDAGPRIDVNELSVGLDLNDDGFVTDTWVPVPSFAIKSNPPGNQLKLSVGSPVPLPR